MDGEAGQSLQSSYVGSSGRVVDAAYDLGKENLVTVTDEGTISLHRRLDRHEEWVQIQEWETPKQQPLSKVCWANPVFGSLLAAGSIHGEISIWGSLSSLWPDKKAEKIQPGMDLKGSVCVPGQVTSLEFAPKARGLRLAASSRSSVRIFRPSPRGSDSWQLEDIVYESRTAHITCLAWQPVAGSLPPMLLIGSSKGAELWMYREEIMEWQQICTVQIVSVSAVSWANSSNRPQELMAVASLSSVWIMGLTARADKPQMEELAELTHPAPVHRVKWHPVAFWLAVSLQNSEVHIWRPNLVGEWKLIQCLVGSPDGDMQI